MDMFYNYNLKIDTNWNLLPWKKINTRLLVIQHKIYKAAKQYNLIYLYQLQKYLLNSNEAKINAIEHITDKLYFFYKEKKQTKYIISDSKKFHIFKNLYTYNLSDENYFIIDQIKQYLIYLCIQPEWESKFFFNYTKEKNTEILNDINNISKYYIYNNFFKYNLRNKYLFLKKNLKKIGLSKYIQKNLKLGFYKEMHLYFKDLKINYINNILIDSYLFIDEFYLFLSKIFLLGLDWYNLFLNKLDLFKNQYNLISVTLHNNKIKSIYFHGIIHFKVLFRNKIFSLHEKTYFHKLVNHQYLDINNMLYNYLFIYFIKLIYPVSNLYLYYYLRRYRNNIFFKYNSIKIKNDYINLFFYNQKIQYIYFNYLS
uniref:Group II intron reverse transcriptase maturase protein n=1 Tax=Membranoptera weeksiae TaxID=158720 RepID=A0A1N7T5L4_9FLOR|nr:group II intron reverse transcriptase maturase protein [Membranoptera weeksiae]AIC36835.1 group II intron reverse transcriptase maturase protein [Membranoptera weeksiae]